MTSQARAARAIDPARLEALLLESLQHYSPSYAEGPATRVFAAALEPDALKAAGLHVQWQQVGELEEERHNLIVTLGPQPPAILWVGHVDTVVVTEETMLRPRVEGDLVYALGAADMKSGCAAACEAIIALARSGVPLVRGVALALVVGEEEYGDGCEAMLEAVSAPLTIIGEPTGLRPCADHFAYLEALLKTQGARVHAALPELGSNAIHAMLSWLTHLMEAATTQDARGMTFNPRSITGGGPMFIVPERCEAIVDVHLPPEVAREAADHLIGCAKHKAQLAHQGCQLDWQEAFWAAGYSAPTDSPLLHPVREAFEVCQRPFQLDAFRSHSDASRLWQAGTLPIVCGPGALEVAHTPEEHVSLAQTLDAARLYLAMFVAAACS